MPGISIHVVDVTRGVVAAGMRVAVTAVSADRVETPVCKGIISPRGLLEDTRLDATFATGRYIARFEIAEYYRSESIRMPAVPFLDYVCYEFGIDDPGQHYHLPFKCTPWGYSCFRGGA